MLHRFKYLSLSEAQQRSGGIMQTLAPRSFGEISSGFYRFLSISGLILGKRISWTDHMFVKPVFELEHSRGTQQT